MVLCECETLQGLKAWQRPLHLQVTEAPKSACDAVQPLSISVYYSWKHGLLQGSEALQSPVHLQVTEASQSARSAVQAAGGSVTTVYYNQLGLRALLKPDWFAEKARQLPRPARPPAKVAVKFDQIGELPPSLEVAS